MTDKELRLLFKRETGLDASDNSAKFTEWVKEYYSRPPRKKNDIMKVQKNDIGGEDED